MKERILLIGLIALLSISLLFNIRQHFQKKSDDNRISELIELGGKAKIVTEYVRDSITHTVYQDIYIKDKSTEKELAITKSYADSLQKALRVSLDKINQVSKVNSKLSTKVQLLEQTSGTKRYRDKWLDLVYYPNTDSLQLDYDVRLNIVRYSKRKHFWRSKSHYIDIFSDDPRVKIEGLKTFRLEEPKTPRFSLGIQLGYGWLPTRGLETTPYIGVGLQYNLITF